MWEIIITSGITTTVLTTLLPFLFKKQVSNYFDKRLEIHKHNLELVTKQIDHDYQRRIHDFNLYATKVHEVYASLYSHLASARNSTHNVTSLYRQYPDFTNTTKENIQKYLEASHADPDRINDILSSFQNKPILKLKLQGFIDLSAINETQELKQKARDYFNQSELYLSDESSKLANKLIFHVHELLVDETHISREKLVGNQPDVELYRGREQKFKEGNDILDELKKHMQKEISVGYYQKLKN